MADELATPASEIKLFGKWSFTDVEVIIVAHIVTVSPNASFLLPVLREMDSRRESSSHRILGVAMGKQLFSGLN